MTQNDLREKVINAEAKVAKRAAILKKQREQLEKMLQKGADQYDITIKKGDIDSSVKKLKEAEESLEGWKEKLGKRITADEYLEANAPEILKDFLEGWKRHAIIYYRQRRIDLIKFRKDLRAKERAARLEALQTIPSLERARKLYEGREVTDYADQGPRQHSGQLPDRQHPSGLDLQQRQRRRAHMGGHHHQGPDQSEALFHQPDQDRRELGREDQGQAPARLGRGRLLHPVGRRQLRITAATCR